MPRGSCRGALAFGATKPNPLNQALGPSGEPIEPIEAVENAGEFPTVTDQGEELAYPRRR